MNCFLLKMSTLLLITTFGAGFAGAQGEPITVTLGTKVQLTSEALGETRDLLIRLPKGYEKTTHTYPVMVVLDGNSHFHHVGNAVTLLKQRGRMPDALVVGIPNKGNRNRDLGSGKERFKQFIRDEVMPMINKNYRTSGQAVLFGHSMAGGFALHTLATQPDLFQDIIAASPSIQAADATLLIELPKLLGRHAKNSRSLYLTRTSLAEEGPALTKAFDQLVAMLEEKAPPALRWRRDIIPNQSHMTTPYLTAYAGLSMIFRDYQFPSLANHREYKDFGGWDGIKNHYAQRSLKYGTPTKIPAGAYRRIGWMLIDDGHVEAGLSLFRSHREQNPQSPRAFAMLGNALAEVGQKEEALQTYTAGLKLAEEQESSAARFLSRRIQELTKETAR